jgi:molybdopterin converting factor small subunit
VKVLLFAQGRLAAGCDECHLQPTGAISQAEFWTLLGQLHPALAPFRKTARLARHGTYLQADEILQPDDEIALIPPVSGG